MTKKKVVVATIADENYFLGTAVLLQSALNCLNDDAELHVIVLDLGLSYEQRSKLAQTLTYRGCDTHKIEFLKLDECRSAERLNGLLRKLKFSGKKQNYFATLILLEELSGFSNCLMIDSDVYVNCDLSKLLDVPNRDAVMLAVQDDAMLASVTSRTVSDFSIMGLDPGSPFFNAGVMLVDLNYWREHQLFDAGLEILSALNASPTPTSGAFLTDQDVLNVLYHGRWESLPVNWNRQCPASLGVFGELDDGKEQILHYLCHPKPWEMPFSELTRPFFASLDQTAFAGWRPNRLALARRALAYWKYRLLYSGSAK